MLLERPATSSCLCFGIKVGRTGKMERNEASLAVIMVEGDSECEYDVATMCCLLYVAGNRS